ncbi:MAG: ATP-binding protein [Hyphomicrobium sp.]
MTDLFDRIAHVFSTSAFRLAAAAVALFLVAAAALAGVLFWQSNRVLTDQVLLTLNSEARVLQGEAAGGVQALANAVQALSRPEGPGLYFLADSTGTKIAGNLNRIPPEIADTQQGGVFRYHPDGASSDAVDGDKGERLAVAVPVVISGGMRLLIGRDIEDQRAFADTVRTTFFVGFGALSLLGLLGGLAISRLLLNRLDAINQTSRSIIAGDLSRRIPLDGTGGELDVLASNLNDMLDRIEALMGSLREVSDNIAHDLKTPINRLRNGAEAALRDPRGGPAYREGLERTIEKADDLIKTFNALLLIARLEAGPLQDDLEEFDLSDLVGDVAEFYEPAAEESGFVLSVERGRGPRVRANRQLMGQVVSNLIENAIKYSYGAGAAGSAITVRSGPREDGGAFISVADRGPGIPAADRARVLKRFVRLEESRTKPGTGLGLSLVAAVARLHGGDILLDDNQPGLKVEVILPKRVVVVQEAALATGEAEARVRE